MELGPGTRLGRYELLGPLGQGGMGEVYRARDERLGREVAIKVLPPAFAKDGERILRFEREARLLAALNHPGIAAIYEVGEQDGRHFLVLELVPGETLGERLRAGSLPLEEARAVARQIAEALEAAHGQGIVHRDLKPANVKLTPAGKVKLLDFGLAKDVAVPSPASDVSSSPTREMAATRAGIVLGTVDYMSPEQARGKPVDKRTDIWSFGCVLYELLAGRPAFAGETPSDVLARVLTRDPDWQLLPATTPPRLLALLRRCLQRDPERRLRDIGDARLEIEDDDAPPPAVAAEPARRPSGFLGLSVMAVAGMGLALLAWPRRPPLAPTQVMRFHVGLPEGYWVNGVQLSPDGTRLAIDAGTSDPQPTRGLFLRRLDDLEATPLPSGERGISPFFSPDGQWLAFQKDNALWKVPLSGGAPVKLCDSRSGDAAWGDDDHIYFFPAAESSGVSRVSAAGGAPQQLAMPAVEKGERGFHVPKPLPGGKAVLFTIEYADKPSSVGIWSAATGTRVLIEGASGARYVPTGHLLYLQSRALWAVRFDAQRLLVRPPAQRVLEGVDNDHQGYSVSTAGQLAYVPARAKEPENALLRVDRKGSARPLTAARRGFEAPRVSPDGQRVALAIQGAGSGDVWIHHVEQDTLTRLTFEGRNRAPVWSPDGASIAYLSVKAGRRTLVSRPADGSGAERELVASADVEEPTSWSRDGALLAFEEYSGHPNYYDLWLLPRPAGPPRPFLRTRFNEGDAEISPDGRWVAYTSNESGERQVYVQSLAGGAKQAVSTEQGWSPVWSRDAKELFFLGKPETLMVASVTAGATLQIGRPRTLFSLPQQSGAFDVFPDGQSFVMVRTERRFRPTAAVVVLNWFEELNRLFPSSS
jgi:eukaryotic-like serine/threonine-protein kinase